MASLLLDPDQVPRVRPHLKAPHLEAPNLRAKEAKAEAATPTPVLRLPVRNPYGGINRRFLPRVKRPFAVHIEGSAARNDGIDLSFGGMMCRADEAVWPGNLVHFDILIGDDPRPLHAVGQVVELVNCRGELAMRVRFEQISPEDRRRIAVWMAQ